MSEPKILVTAAAGKIGGAVSAQLLDAGFRVRAIVRSHDARSAGLAARGADVVKADLFDPLSLAEAMRGCARAFYCPPMDAHMIDSAVAFADAARRSDLESIVCLSQWLAQPEHPVVLTRQHWLADRLFAALPGVSVTTVNPGFFADNYLRTMDFAALLGIFPVLTGASRNAPPSNEDIARVVAAALAAPERHAGKSYRPTGPALLSGSEMADAIARVLGRRVRAVELPVWMFLRAARLQGESAFVMYAFQQYLADHVDGAFAAGAPTSDVLDVTGRVPEDFETTAARYAKLPFARRTVPNVVRAALNFGLVPFTPAYDFERLNRFLPHPPTPRRSMESPIWRREHLEHGTAAVREAVGVS